jgi:DNA-directed RNA polymerase subunit RPC12/RpoP
MKTCVECGKQNLEYKDVHSWHYPSRTYPNVFIDTYKYQCPDCGSEFIIIPQIKKLKEKLKEISERSIALSFKSDEWTEMH